MPIKCQIAVALLVAYGCGLSLHTTAWSAHGLFHRVMAHHGHEQGPPRVQRFHLEHSHAPFAVRHGHSHGRVMDFLLAADAAHSTPSSSQDPTPQPPLKISEHVKPALTLHSRPEAGAQSVMRPVENPPAAAALAPPFRPPWIALASRV